MGPWRSDFEFVISGHQLDASSFDDVRRGHLLRPGFRVRVRDSRVQARWPDWSAQLTSPVLRGRLVSDASGTRIVGSISWVSLLMWPVMFGFAALVLLACGMVAVGGGAPGAGAVLVLGGAGFAGLAAWELLTEADQRADEEQQLRDGLTEAFDVRAPAA